MGDELSAMQRKFGFTRGSVPVVKVRADLRTTGETGRRSACAPIFQHEQLERVAQRTNGAILAFFVTRAVGSTFHAAELWRHVAGQCGGAPASPDRVLRLLRKRGALNYRVINRADSLYRIIPKGEKP